MVEMLFVLNLISFLILITMTIRTPRIKDKQISNIISTKINAAKMNSIIHKEKTYVYFNENELKIKSDSYNDTYTLPKGDTFDLYQFSYNKYGRIKTAKTVIFHGLKKDYKFKFQVGTGTFYVET